MTQHYLTVGHGFIKHTSDKFNRSAGKKNDFFVPEQVEEEFLESLNHEELL